MDTITDTAHPDIWYDDDVAGCWWGKGHLTLEQMAEGAREYDGNFDDDGLEGYHVEHLWRSDCGEDRFDTDARESADYPHPVTRLI